MVPSITCNWKRKHGEATYFPTAIVPAAITSPCMIRHTFGGSTIVKTTGCGSFSKKNAWLGRVIGRWLAVLLCCLLRYFVGLWSSPKVAARSTKATTTTRKYAVSNCASPQTKRAMDVKKETRLQASSILQQRIAPIIFSSINSNNNLRLECQPPRPRTQSMLRVFLLCLLEQKAAIPFMSPVWDQLFHPIWIFHREFRLTFRTMPILFDSTMNRLYC